MADPTIIAADTYISGRIQGDDDLVIQGRVDGTIELSETLTVGSDGRLDGEIQAREVVVEGRVQGTIEAEERVVLAATALAVADIRAPVVEMADGARLRGELTIGADGAPATSSRETTSGRRRSRSTSTTPRNAASSPARSTSRPARQSTTTTRATQPAATATATAVVEESDEADADDDEEPAAPTPDTDADTEDETPLSEERIEQYRRDFTVKELREKLRNLDLRVSGTKDELIERLLLAEE